MEEQTFSMKLLDNPLPGTKGVIKVNSMWFCSKCEKSITPIWIETLEVETPSCEDCFLNELIQSNPEIGELLDPLAEAIGEGDEDTIWEEYGFLPKQ